MNILQEADALVNGDRAKDYGHPSKDFKKVARLWSVVIDAEITPEQVGLCMICLKISREINRHKRDNLVDIAGYAATIEKLGDPKPEICQPIK